MLIMCFGFLVGRWTWVVCCKSRKQCVSFLISLTWLICCEGISQVFVICRCFKSIIFDLIPNKVTNFLILSNPFYNLEVIFYEKWYKKNTLCTLSHYNQDWIVHDTIATMQTYSSKLPCLVLSRVTVYAHQTAMNIP